MNDATRRTNWIVICPRRGMKQWVEQLYTVSVYITNIQCTNTWLLLRYYCIPIVILNNVQGSLIKILGHSLFALCLCLFTLVRLFQTRASTNVNNLGAALHFWYGTSSNMVVWSDGLNGSWSLAGKAILLAMHVIVAERPGILLTNSRGWNFMSEIGLARACSNEASRQNNKINAWFYCFYQKCYFFRSDSLTHWLTWLIKHPFSPFSPIYLFIKFGWAPSGLQNRLLSWESVLLNVGRNWQVDQNSKQWVRYFHVFRNAYPENSMFKGFAQLTSAE